VNTFGVYRITNKINNTSYIGSTTRSFYKRWGFHIYELRKGVHHCQHLQRAWNKYGEDSFEFIAIESFSMDDFPNLSRRDLSIKMLEIEQHYLDTFTDKYNSRPIAGSNLGCEHSDESKIKMSVAKKGKPAHPNTVAANRKANIGRKASPEERAKLSKALKGRKVSKESAELTAKKLRGMSFKNKRKVLICDEDYNILKICKDSKECSEYLEVSHSWIRAAAFNVKLIRGVIVMYESYPLINNRSKPRK
jgi:group I intron endonuclease